MCAVFNTVSLPLPNEDFGRRNKRWNADFWSTFQWILAQIEYSRPWKVLENPHFVCCQTFQNLRLGSIKFSLSDSFNGRRIIFMSWKRCQRDDCYKCHLERIYCSVFISGVVSRSPSATVPCGKFMLTKRRFWKVWQQMRCRFSKHFSMVSSPNRVLTPFKRDSKIHISSVVKPSKIFVWEG